MTVVLLVIAVPVLLDTAFAMVYSIDYVTSALAMKSILVLMERPSLMGFVSVVSWDVLKVVNTVTPWDMAKE